jgi:hypothetical protein
MPNGGSLGNFRISHIVYGHHWECPMVSLGHEWDITPMLFRQVWVIFAVYCHHWEFPTVPLEHRWNVPLSPMICLDKMTTSILNHPPKNNTNPTTMVINSLINDF